MATESKNAGEPTPTSPRPTPKTRGSTKRTPRSGTRFPSAVFGDNVRWLRQGYRLSQREVAEMMNLLGFDGWSAVTVSDIELGTRNTNVDELFGLGTVLDVSIPELLDPETSRAWEDEIDLGFSREAAEACNAPTVRELILPPDHPARLERRRLPHTQFRARFLRVADEAKRGLL